MKLFEWKEHSAAALFCLHKQHAGRPPLKRARHGSDTKSGRESQSEVERDTCLTFNQLMDMLPKLDKEMAVAVALSCKLVEHLNFFRP